MIGKDDQLISTIRHFVRDNGYAPTVRELAEMMGVSVTTAQNSLKDLAEKGKIIKRERTARGYRLRGM